MRHRSTTTGGFSTPKTWSHYLRSSCAAAWSPNGSDTSYVGTEKIKTIIDVETPKFLSLLKCGRFLPINPVDISTVTTTQTSGSGTHFVNLTGGCYRAKHEGDSHWIRPWLVVVPPLDEDLISSVVQQAIANSKQAVFDVTTNLGELPQTAQMIGNSMGRVFNFADRAARRARRFRKNPLEMLRAFSGYWLEYRYGWRPAISTIQDLVSAMDNRVQTGQFIRGNSSTTTSLDDDVTATWTQDGGTGTGTETHLLQGTRKYRGFAYSEVNSNGIRWGHDPILTAWELIPYSFVVDWFIDIGTWLQAVSPAAGADIRGSGCSVRDDYTMTQAFSLSWSGGSGGGAHSGTFGTVSTEVAMQRYTRFPHSGGSLPVWNIRLTPTRILDLSALIMQRILGVKRVLR